MNESENFKEQTLDESTMTSFDHLIIMPILRRFQRTMVLITIRMKTLVVSHMVS